MALNFEEIKEFLPKYLTPSQNQELFSELKSFPEKFSYYSTLGAESEILQGDAVTGLEIVDIEKLERKQIKGVILSNSCDIDPNNPRALPPQVCFSPLISISKLRNLLEQNSGRSAAAIDSIIISIRQQETTSVCYFPASGSLANESVIFLDNIHSMPLSRLLGTNKSKIFTLSTPGFYLFLVKLSIHFCRFQEGVYRPFAFEGSAESQQA